MNRASGILEKVKQKIRYRTKDGYVVLVVIDSVGRYFKATTNDSKFYDEFLRDLYWKPF